MEVSVSVFECLHGALLLQSLAVPNPPALRVVLPRFSNTYLVWRDPEPFVGDIIGLQIHYLIDCVPQNIQELGKGVRQFSVSGIKGSTGKTHSISLRAKTASGCGTFSTPLVFTFCPIGEPAGKHTLGVNLAWYPLLPSCSLCGLEVWSGRKCTQLLYTSHGEVPHTVAGISTLD